MKLALPHPAPGAVVEYMEAGGPKIAYVLDQTGDKLRLLGAGLKESVFSAKRLLPWTGPNLGAGLSRNEVKTRLTELEATRHAKTTAVDPLAIWELAQGEVDRAAFSWFVELAVDKPDFDDYAAHGRALIACKSHFKFDPPAFEVFSAELVDKRLEQAKIAEERRLLAEEGAPFIRELWARQNERNITPKTKLSPETAARLESLFFARLADPESEDRREEWAGLTRGLPDDLGRLPFFLLRTWGKIAEHHNFLYAQAEYAQGDAWSGAFADEIDRLVQAADEAALPRDEAPYVSVDAKDILDVDDACHVERTGEGFRVRVALANPAYALGPDSPLWPVLLDRSTSVYLPEGDSHMFPERLTARYSLKAGRKTPALTLAAEVDAAGSLVAVDFAEAVVHIAENADYASVETRLDAPETPQSAPLHAAYALAEVRRKLRLDNGAVIIERPDVEIVLSGNSDNPKVEFAHKAPAPKAQLLVSELMILVNEAMGLFGRDRALPLLHRTLDTPASKELCGLFSDPVSANRAVRSLVAPDLEVAAKPHGCLAVAAYAPASSPLRRLVDLVNEAQTLALLRTGAPLFSAEALGEMIPTLKARAEAAGKIQRFRPRYWKLLAVKQRLAENFPAVVVDVGETLVAAVLTEMQLLIRAPKRLFGERIRLGGDCRIRFGKADPLMNELVVKEAWALDPSSPDSDEAGLTDPADRL